MTRRTLAQSNALSSILFMATTVSAMFLTLSNFEAISSLSVPLGCVFAYNTPMQGCNVNDFGDGNTCSGKCRGILSIVESNIQASCMVIDVGTGSLLNKAQNGELVQSLCGNKPQAEPGDVISRPPPGSFTRIPSDPPAASATPTESVRRTVPAPTTSEPSTEQIPKSASTRAQEPPTTSTSSETTSRSPTPEASTTEQPRKVSTSTSSASSIIATTSTQDPPAPKRPPGAGGGSPFDPVIFGSSGTTMKRLRSWEALVGCVFCVYLLR